ncbi:MAG: cyclic nucleotide-binding domain-containing protein [Alphaproteobacteria bacterium]|nr:cyclic nucleotide-binding domain-containing protein [Alphaproteobacteria bacterium]
MQLIESTVRPKDMSAEERDAFTAELYAVHSEVFDGVDPYAFRKYVVDSTAERTEIKVFRTPEGELAGYVATHAFDRVLNGEDCVVLRAEAGMRRAFRGSNVVGPFIVQQVLRTALLDERPAWYMGSLVHPSSFMALTRHTGEFWPHPERPIPPDILAFMVALAEDFHLEMVDPDRPLVREVGWITRDSESEREYWRGNPRRLVRFFVEQNPGYSEGHGLVTLIPLTTRQLAQGVMDWGARTLKRRMDRMTSALRKATGTEGLSRAQAALELVSSGQLADVPVEDLVQLLERGDQMELRAGEVLFREGERSDAMYVLLKGSAFVLRADPDGESTVLDQLDAGECFGEMAMLLGSPRTATVRAATDCVVLRIHARAAQAQGPALVSALWTLVSWRRFDNLTREYVEPSLQGRRDWWAQAEELDLGPELWHPQTGWILVISGQIVFETPPAVISAPSLTHVCEGVSLRAPKKAHLVWLPDRPEDAG